MNTNRNPIRALVALCLASVVSIGLIASGGGPDEIANYFFNASATTNGALYQGIEADSYTCFFNIYASWADSAVDHSGSFDKSSPYSGVATWSNEAGTRSTIYSANYEINGETDPDETYFDTEIYHGSLSGAKVLNAYTVSYAGNSWWEEQTSQTYSFP